MLGSQDIRTVMTLGKLKFSDISFSTCSKHQMLTLSEHKEANHKKSADIIIHVGLRLVSLKNLPQHKSRNICTKFQAYTLILSIFLLTALATVALTL